ncbi:MAG: GTP cyclohydrolase I FolE [Chloroflexi bacterium RBG_13_46_14]|nr:MAG: GTP cyclohydrolase I FolE [Chloroflexi bacterium RBG_13_46_14]
MQDIEGIKEAVISMIKAIGDNPEREGLVGTPGRVADMFAELFMGMDIDPKSVLSVEFEEGHREMVILRDIPFYSMCEHHLLPFFGTAHVGYIPNEKGRVVGASKIARVVEIVARRPQIQERMTSQIADAINEGINPSGVGVVIQAEHLCMMMRGIRKPGSSMQTSALRGTFRSKPSTRAEFLSLINSR